MLEKMFRNVAGKFELDNNYSICIFNLTWSCVPITLIHDHFVPFYCYISLGTEFGNHRLTKLN